MPGLARRPSACQLSAIDGEDLVAVDDVALLVDDDHAVGVAVERDADVGAHLPHLLRQRLGRGRADVVVDVEAVGLDADLDHFRAEFPQRLGRDLVGGAVGAIDHHPQAVEARRRAAASAWRIRCSAPATSSMRLARPSSGDLASRPARSSSISASMLRLDLVRQLEPVGPEQLDAVVLVKVVGGGDHHAEVAAHRPGQHRHRRRRRRAEQQHVHADRGEAGDHRVFDHVAGKAGVLADDDAVAIVAALEHAGRPPGRPSSPDRR